MAPMRPLLLGLLAVLIALTALAPIANNDIWLHLKTGSLILERGSVPRVEEYTFTRAGTPWVAHEWAAQTFFALVDRAGGAAALSLLYALLVGAIMCIVYAGVFRATRAVRGTAADTARAIALVLAAAVFLLMMSFLAIRPHLFTFLFAAAWPVLLARTQATEVRVRRRALAALLVLQVVWANLHGGFVIGILLAAIHSVDAALRTRRLARAAALPAALAAVSLLNPYGWRIYALVSGFNEPFIRQVIVEWRSPFASGFAGSPLFWLFLVWLGAAVAAAGWAARRRELAPAMTVLAFGFLSCMSRRHISLMAVVTAPLIGRGAAALLARVLPSPRAAIALVRAAAACVLLLAAGIAMSAFRAGALAPRPGAIARNIPVEAVEVMCSEGLHGRVFTSLGMASYVTWRGWPDLLTNADSRLEILGGDFLRTVLTASRDPRRFEAFEARWPVDYALLPWRLESVKGAIDAMSADPDWALIYFDDVAALYARRPEPEGPPAGGEAYRAIDPVRFMRQHGFAPGTDLAVAEAEARRAVAAPPSMALRPAANGVARMMLGSALMRSGRLPEAADALRAAIETDPGLAPAYGMLAACLGALGDEQGSRAILRKLERRSPGSVPDDLL